MSTDRDIIRGERCTSTGTIKGCGRRATWDRDGKPIVTLYAVANPKEPTVLVCAACIARAGLPVPEGVPTRFEHLDPGDPRSCSDAHASGVLALEPGVKRESSADTIKAITAPPVARKEAECALLGCGRPARIYHCYREPYSTARKFFCSAEHLKGYALTVEQNDGTVQEEVSDEWQTVSTHGGESQAAQLVRERYATWAKRAHKWHAYLERERAWSTHGRLLSVLTGAASTLAAATVAPHFAAGVVGALMIATALIAWRGQVAQSRLESSRAADAWVSADRLAEVYRGLVVELDAVITTCDDSMKREQAEQVLAKSQQIEGAARFGVPEGLRSVLVEVCK